MRNLVAAASTLALTAGLAQAGGIDRSGQNIGLIFAEGSAVELSFGSINPSISGTYVGGAQSSGDVGNSYTQVGFGYKQQFNDKLSLSLIYDQPFGASTSYPATGTFAALRNTSAELESDAITLLGRYHLTDNFSVHGGLKGQWLAMNVSIPGGGALNYEGVGERNFASGYVLGAAYEVPEIALRVALTYSSEVEHNITTREKSVATGGAFISSPETTVKTPKSINLDFQSGVAANTLVFGSIRWAEWTATNISPNHYTNTLSRGALQSYQDNVVTYNLGVGRKFTDNWSGSISIGHEKANGGTTGNLGPTDGFTSVSLGARYTEGPHTISGGVRFVRIGDATSSGAGGANGTFADNTATAVGLSYRYSF